MIKSLKSFIENSGILLWNSVKFEIAGRHGEIWFGLINKLI